MGHLEPRGNRVSLLGPSRCCAQQFLRRAGEADHSGSSRPEGPRLQWPRRSSRRGSRSWGCGVCERASGQVSGQAQGHRARPPCHPSARDGRHTRPHAGPAGPRSRSSETAISGQVFKRFAPVSLSLCPSPPGSSRSHLLPALNLRRATVLHPLQPNMSPCPPTPSFLPQFASALTPASLVHRPVPALGQPEVPKACRRLLLCLKPNSSPASVAPHPSGCVHEASNTKTRPG